MSLRAAATRIYPWIENCGSSSVRTGEPRDGRFRWSARPIGLLLALGLVAYVDGIGLAALPALANAASLVGAFALGGLVSGASPAWRAARERPVEAREGDRYVRSAARSTHSGVETVVVPRPSISTATVTSRVRPRRVIR